MKRKNIGFAIELMPKDCLNFLQKLKQAEMNISFKLSKNELMSSYIEHKNYGFCIFSEGILKDSYFKETKDGNIVITFFAKEIAGIDYEYYLKKMVLNESVYFCYLEKNSEDKVFDVIEKGTPPFDIFIFKNGDLDKFVNVNVTQTNHIFKSDLLQKELNGLFENANTIEKIDLAIKHSNYDDFKKIIKENKKELQDDVFASKVIDLFSKNWIENNLYGPIFNDEAKKLLLLKKSMSRKTSIKLNDLIWKVFTEKYGSTFVFQPKIMNYCFSRPSKLLSRNMIFKLFDSFFDDCENDKNKLINLLMLNQVSKANELINKKVCFDNEEIAITLLNLYISQKQKMFPVMEVFKDNNEVLKLFINFYKECAANLKNEEFEKKLNFLFLNSITATEKQKKIKV